MMLIPLGPFPDLASPYGRLGSALGDGPCGLFNFDFASFLPSQGTSNSV